MSKIIFKWQVYYLFFVYLIWFPIFSWQAEWTFLSNLPWYSYYYCFIVSCRNSNYAILCISTCRWSFPIGWEHRTVTRHSVMYHLQIMLITVIQITVTRSVHMFNQHHKYVYMIYEWYRYVITKIWRCYDITSARKSL